VRVRAAQVPTAQVDAKDQFGVVPVLVRAPAIASPEWTLVFVRLAVSAGAEIAIVKAVDAAEKSPEVSATARVSPESEQAVVGVPEIVALVAEKASPEQVEPSVDEISVPPL